MKYKKVKTTKKVNLFSNDADKSGKSFTWYNIPHLAQPTDVKLKVSNFSIPSPTLPNPIHHLKFENNIDDEYGGTMTNLGSAPTFSQTVVKKDNYSAHFDGLQEYVLNENWFAGLQKFTISFWVMFENDYNTTSTFIRQQKCLLIRTFGGDIIVNFGNEASWNFKYTFPFDLSNPSNRNVWFNWSFVIDLSAKTVIWYNNGVNISGVNDNDDISYDTFPDYNSETRMFYYENDNSDSFKGYLDDFRIYDMALSQNQIHTLVDNFTSIYTIRCPEVFDSYDSDNKYPIIYHQKEKQNKKKYLNPEFGLSPNTNSLKMDILRYRNNDPLAEYILADDFIITLSVETEDPELVELDSIESYHHLPQQRILY